jgi:hypothetical protein
VEAERDKYLRELMPLASKNVFYAQVQLRPMQYKSQQPAYKPEVV